MKTTSILNRNFLLAEEKYSGSPPLSGAFRSAMKPSRPRTRFGFWTARMAMLALRHGIQSFWETLPVGQYDYPDWLYYGGGGPTQSSQALHCFLPTLLDEADEVVHLDFHTGLGRWAECELLVSESEGLDNCEWWLEHFDRRHGAKAEKFHSRVRSSRRLRAVASSAVSRLQVSLRDSRVWHLFADASDRGAGRRVAVARRDRDRSRKSSRRVSGWPILLFRASRSWRTKTLQTGISLVRQASNVMWGKRGN